MQCLLLDFQLPGCRSLKEKRQRLLGIRDKFGKTTNLAVTESDHHDKHQNSQWCFVAVGNDAKLLDKMLTQIENYANSDVDAVICNVQRFAL